MARNGTNLSQVLVANADVVNATAMGSLASGRIGVYKNGTNSSTVTAKVDETVAGAPQWIVDQVQFAQGRTAGNPIASPIIDTAEIVRVEWTAFVASAAAANTEATISSTANNTYGLKLILKYTGHINDYDEYANPSNSLNDRLGEIRNYSFTSTAGTADGIADGLIAAINADSKAIVTASQTGAGKILLTAKDQGSVFQVIDDGVTLGGVALAFSANTCIGSFAPTTGVGNYAQVLSDEKKVQGKYGHHNRLYLPRTAETYATTAYQYHRCDVLYRHNWPNSTGIVPAGELNVIRIYVADSSTAMAHGDTTLDTILALPAGSIANKTHVFQV